MAGGDSIKYSDELIETLVATGIGKRALANLADFSSLETFIYDELDRLTELTYEDERTVSWTYDPEGNVTKMTDPQGKVARYEYFRDNLLHRVIIERPTVCSPTPMMWRRP